MSQSVRIPKLGAKPQNMFNKFTHHITRKLDLLIEKLKKYDKDRTSKLGVFKLGF